MTTARPMQFISQALMALPLIACLLFSPGTLAAQADSVTGRNDDGTLYVLSTAQARPDRGGAVRCNRTPQSLAISDARMADADRRAADEAWSVADAYCPGGVALVYELRDGSVERVRESVACHRRSGRMASKSVTAEQYTATHGLSFACHGGPGDAPRRGVGVDAAVTFGGKLYLFSGANYVRYDLTTYTIEEGFPEATAHLTNWPGHWDDGIDAAVNMGNGKAYFFRGAEYARYDIASARIDPLYPLPIRGNFSASWPGEWDAGVDGAMNPGNGNLYFFRRGQYLAYDIATGDVHEGYPLSILHHFAYNWTGDVDAAVSWGGHIYFIDREEYRGQDVGASGITRGYPRPMTNFASNWMDPATWPSRVAPPPETFRGTWAWCMAQGWGEAYCNEVYGASRPLNRGGAIVEEPYRPEIYTGTQRPQPSAGDYVAFHNSVCAAFDCGNPTIELYVGNGTGVSDRNWRLNPELTYFGR